MRTERCVDCQVDLGTITYGRVPRCERCEQKKEFTDKVLWIQSKVKDMGFHDTGYSLLCPLTESEKKEVEEAKKEGMDFWVTPKRLFRWLHRTVGDFTPDQIDIIHDLTLFYVNENGEVLGIDCERREKELDKAVQNLKRLIKEGVVIV